jgi:hypothetical protein
MKFLTKEEILNLNYAQSTDQVKQLKKLYSLNKQDAVKAAWHELDLFINMLLHLEDHIYNYEDPRRSLMKIEE